MKKESTKIIHEAQEYYKNIKKTQTVMREKGLDCQRMIGCEQWEDGDKKSREKQQKPIVTVNRLSKPVDVVVNKHQQNLPQIKVEAFEDGDVDVTRVVNGLLRHIQHSNMSNAAVAYRTGYFHAVGNGYGYWRVNTQFLDEKSFDQEIVIEEIEDQNSVYMEDEDHCIVTEKISKKDFEAKYPDADTTSWDNDNAFIINDDEVLIAEYWVRIKTPTKIYKVERQKQQENIVNLEGVEVEQGTEIVTLTEEELKEIQGEYEIIDERDTETIKVKQYLLSPSEILDTTDWKGKYIPIVGVFGQRYRTSDGHRFYKSLIFDSIGPQKMLNYSKSQKMEILKNAPQNKPIGAEGQFENHEDEWSNPDEYPYLEYKPTTLNGQVVPAPQFSPPPQMPNGIVQSIQEDENDIKATSGIYDPSLGANSKEHSGRALIARQNASDLSTDQFNISFNIALHKTGVIVVDLVPHIIDTERQLRMLGDDMKEEIVTVNKKYIDPNGDEKYYDLTKALNCDVMVTASYGAPTRRQEIVETLMEFMKVFPASAQVTGDLIAGSLDFEKSEELEKRLKALIPQQLFDRMQQMESEAKGGVTPEQMQLQKMNQAMQQLQGQLQKTMMDAKRLFQENEALKKRDNAIKLQVEQTRQQGDIKQEQIKVAGNLEQETMKQDGANKRELIKNRKGLYG